MEAERKASRIGKALEAKVEIECFTRGEEWQLLHRYENSLKELFNVSEVKIVFEPDSGGSVATETRDLIEKRNIRAKVLPADGAKCTRCWNYRTDVGVDPRWHTVCGRCAGALDEIGFPPLNDEVPV